MERQHNTNKKNLPALAESRPQILEVTQGTPIHLHRISTLKNPISLDECLPLTNHFFLLFLLYALEN